MTKVLLLTLDALRYDAVFEDYISTPNLDELIENSVVYERAFSNGPGTSAAFPAILYSSKQNTKKEAPKSKSIADYFSEEGFETIGITSNPRTSSYFGYNKGFDIFKDFIEPTNRKKNRSFLFKYGRKIIRYIKPLYRWFTSFNAEHNLPYERAEAINKEIEKKLKEGKDLFFWAHYMDTHAPYSPPEEYGKEYCPEEYERRGKLTTKLYQENLEEKDVKDLWKLYLTELRYLDDELGDLFSTLYNLEEKVYIIVTADHGEEFGERGRYQHCQYYEFNLHVPLIFKYSDNKNEKISKFASHLDIIPTIISEFQDTHERFSGINLSKESRDFLKISRGDTDVLITDKWKLIENSTKCLFDIEETLKEDNNLYKEKPEVVKRLRNLGENVTEGIEI